VFGWINIEFYPEEPKKLKISVTENTTGEDREVIVTLQSGNCFANFPITQQATKTK
jgi:hypothetical protein